MHGYRSIIFAGQGSQCVGMGNELQAGYPEARSVFRQVGKAIDVDIARIVREGPVEKLALTENTQPALLAMSIAVIRALSDSWDIRVEDTAKYVAGNSLGAYCALVAAESLEIEDAARLLKKRGQAMQEASPVGKGAMAAIVDVEFKDVERICAWAQSEKGGVCQIGVDNAPGRITISGTKADVEYAVAIAKEEGAVKSVVLPVSIPSHCALMESAAKKLKVELEATRFRKPSVPVIDTSTVRAVRDPDEIRKGLITQLVSPIRWRESALHMEQNGVREFVECGAQNVQANITKLVAPAAETRCLSKPAEIESFAQRLGVRRVAALG